MWNGLLFRIQGATHVNDLPVPSNRVPDRLGAVDRRRFRHSNRHAEPEPRRPNILLIYTDDHSYRTVSCYPEAYPWARTPNIDRLAHEGIRFESAYIGTWCMPSRATLLTGHHQFGVQSMRMVGE